jgi:hypothetical protein
MISRGGRMFHSLRSLSFPRKSEWVTTFSSKLGEAHRHSRESGSPASDELKSLALGASESGGFQQTAGDNPWPDLKILTRFFLDFARG